MPAQQEEDIVGWLLVVELQCVDHQTLTVLTFCAYSIASLHTKLFTLLSNYYIS